MSDNFNKFCGVLILLLLGLSTLFTLRASAEEYTPPAEDSTQTVTDSEETHEVVQVQGVQTYDPTLYEKLDTLQESLNTLIDIMTPAETGTEDAQSGEPAQDYTAQLETISGQLVDLRTAAEMATAETAQPQRLKSPLRIIVYPKCCCWCWPPWLWVQSLLAWFVAFKRKRQARPGRGGYCPRPARALPQK